VQTTRFYGHIRTKEMVFHNFELLEHLLLRCFALPRVPNSTSGITLKPASCIILLTGLQDSRDDTKAGLAFG
jgi:hypothetical protein